MDSHRPQPRPRPGKINMTQDPVNRTLFRMVVPMIFGLVAVIVSNLVDIFYIGMLGVRELAAISFTFPVTLTVMSLGFGLNTGTSTMVSHSIGQDDPARVRRITTDSLGLTVALMGFVAFLGYWSIDPLFHALGANAEQVGIIHEFMDVWFIGAVFIAIPIVGNGAIRATGDSLTPSLIMLVIAGVNAVLDPFLIFGIGPFPELGVRGAAIATVIAFFCAMLAELWVIGIRDRMLEIRWPRLTEVWASWSGILYIGLPAAFVNILPPISNAILTRMASGFGEDAVAAFGVGTRLESLAMLGTISLAIVITPFIGQNFGAKLYERIRAGLAYCTRFSMLWGGGACLILAAGAYPIASVFSDSESVQALIRTYLWTVPVSFGFYGLTMVASSAFSGLHKPLQSTTISLVRLFVVIIPLAYFASQAWGMPGLFLGVAVGNVASGIWGMAWLRWRSLPRLMRRESQESPAA